jgi:hypothetical protein
MVPPAAKREAVAHLQALLDVSERRACRVIAADRTVKGLTGPAQGAASPTHMGNNDEALIKTG